MMDIHPLFTDGILREEQVITIPHQDIELGVERKHLEYFLTFPKDGVNADTGLVFCIPAWGDRADSPYQRTKLRPYIADRYNCVTCGINYFGIQPVLLDEYLMAPSPTFMKEIHALYGIHPHDYTDQDNISLKQLSNLLCKKGITRLPSSCRSLFRLKNGEYESFGFLPALDHLIVCGEVLKRVSLNSSRIIAFGSSYGGYIALLLAKYAPYTFSAVIDNSGFVRPSMNNVAGVDLIYNANIREFCGVAYPWVIDNLWRIHDELSPYYFSDAHRSIRSLLPGGQDHHPVSKYYIFHAEEDCIAPTQEKRIFVNIIEKHAGNVQARFIRKEDLDGRLFKTTEHGMQASLRGLFDLAYQMDGAGLAKNDQETDFSLESSHAFRCKGQFYRFDYKNESQLQVSIQQMV